MLPSFQPILAAASPDASIADQAVAHVVPHALHHDPLFSLSVASPGTDIPVLGIYNGQYDFYITNHLAMTLLTAVIVLLTFTYVAFRVRVSGQGLDAYRTKGRFGQLFETMLTFIREEVARPNLHGLTDKYIPYIWTIFFFILFANVLGLLPLGYIMYLLTGDLELTHWGGTATGNLSLNVVLAMGSFIAILFIGIRETGAKAFFAHFNPVGWDDPKMLLIGIPLYFLEWMGLVIKCVVLAMRLFGTMMAGHLVIASFVLLIFQAARVSAALGLGVEVMVILGGIALTMLELFIAFLQAFIFTFLTVLFISTAGTHHPDDEHTPHAHTDNKNPFDHKEQMDIDRLLTPDRLNPAVEH
jgi:F-type H+-transporting ATPase subunit a